MMQKHLKPGVHVRNVGQTFGREIIASYSRTLCLGGKSKANGIKIVSSHYTRAPKICISNK
jgi:hypothetical protein